MFLASPVSPYPASFHPSSLFDAPRTGHRHGGLDLMARANAQLLAPEAAEVERIYVSTAGGGGSIWLDHGLIPAFADPGIIGGPQGHTRTKHQHIALGDDGQPLFLVAEGDRVSRGQPFAIAGDSGNAGAIHDHYEVHVDGKRIDPRQVTASISGVGWLERWDARGMLPGPYSRLCQTYLVWWGSGIDVDGIMGPKTGVAVRAFQARMGLLVDEVVGPKTWAALKPALAQ